MHKKFTFLDLQINQHMILVLITFLINRGLAELMERCKLDAPIPWVKVQNFQNPELSKHLS